MNRLHTRVMMAVVIALGAAQTATASSPEAWEEFAADVVAKCRDAAGVGEDTLIEVDPFGSTSFGLAIVYAPSGKVICVYDKQTQTVELGGTLVVSTATAE